MSKEKYHGAILPAVPSLDELRAQFTDDDIRELGRELGYLYPGDPGYEDASELVDSPCDSSDHRGK
ncbi:hypothetical protein [Schleiferilactobacillus shenzhenensis]|uniref:hypothetical protein n=1 Tax=Schleiferilactobacillus shenzhenensis TaxID=1231337 RepID=UPI0012DE1D15|nr:hypothetical protein [Schleiferilactobacillus shenzhenensis]